MSLYTLTPNAYRIQQATSIIQQGYAKLQALQNAQTRLTAIMNELGKIDIDNGDLQVIRDCLLSIADEEQDRIIAFIEKVCSDGLSYVFETPLSVSFDKKISGGFPVMEIEVQPLGGTKRDPLMANGGGLVETLALLLRVCFSYFFKDLSRPVLLLDEPCAKLDTTRVPKLATLLNDLSERLSLQIILVTHHPAFAEVATNHFVVEQGTVIEQTKDFDSVDLYNEDV